MLSLSLANVGCCCRLQVCAGSERSVPQASFGSMVKSQKSAGRKSSQCHRRQVLKKKKERQLCLLVIVQSLPFTVRLWKTHFLYTLLRPNFISPCAKCPLNYRHLVVRFYCVSVEKKTHFKLLKRHQLNILMLVYQTLCSCLVYKMYNHQTQSQMLRLHLVLAYKLLFSQGENGNSPVYLFVCLFIYSCLTFSVVFRKMTVYYTIVVLFNATAFTCMRGNTVCAQRPGNTIKVIALLNINIFIFQEELQRQWMLV